MQQIAPFSIGAPGFLGLNTQDSPVEMNPGFALEATNCVIDKYGRIGSRKGWSKVNANTNSDLATSNIECIGEVVQNDGTTTLVLAGGGFLFKLATTTITTLTYGGGGVAPTITTNNWQFVCLNGIGIFWQRGYDPLIYDPAVSTTTFRRLSEKTAAAGTIPQANCAVSAYGRIWCADTATDKNTVTWSDIITPQVWTGGTAGSLNLVGVWPTGGDEIVGLAAHNNFLVIFGKRQTLIYSGADDPATMQLSDTLNNIGCIARDSIQNTGEDVLFLSDTGVRSLTRTIQEKSAPLRGLTKNVYNDVQNYISAETLANIKSVYSSSDAFYLITFPASSVTFCLDTRSLLEDGSARVTTWTSINPKSMCFLRSRKLYIGKAGYLGEYATYYDNNAEYRLNYYSPWVDFGNPIQTSIFKKLIAYLVGARDQTVVFKWGFDFIPAQFSQTTSVSTTSATAAEYGSAEYAIAEYNSSIGLSVVQVNPGGSGKVAQIGIESQIAGFQISIQKIDIHTKNGRI